MKKRRKREGGSRIKWKVEIKKERMKIYGYTCVVEKKQKQKQTNLWMKERKRIRNDHLEILPQYFHNIFTINFK